MPSAGAVGEGSTGSSSSGLEECRIGAADRGRFDLEDLTGLASGCVSVAGCPAGFFVPAVRLEGVVVTFGESAAGVFAGLPRFLVDGVAVSSGFVESLSFVASLVVV